MTQPLTFLDPALTGRDYEKTQVVGLNWACPDCGAVVEFFRGRPIHDRWHASLVAPVEFDECGNRIKDCLRRGRWLYCARRHGHRGPHSCDRNPGPTSTIWREAR